ncbi:MAG: aspartate carbamoyltransferase [Ignavibacteria bacterium GWA2_55_11]|nr:MAG: aspartate carbamoyltransferase [Ignavibacteria bacterium GWA2_55_11]OGU74497.1 MAG: aspartate carbamoyltransferase [Ignavibacteria bacterium RIFCSPLOWO2_02_FULL_55_14]OGU76265.1 MAG: aspartate carbamoyltransferase [Ignavibacteria bacterium RIFCSPLOWO2_12_FULL_56_21]HAV23488.1 aspartate carbamoyltransferase [Bacteroidota bacterium]
MKLSGRHLLGLENMSRDELDLILETAVSFKEVLERPIKKVPPLQGKTIANLFFESSTRTRISFELAERRLSADVISFSQSGSSVSKGETLKDTARNIEAMKIDMVVVRHASAGAAHFLSRVVDANIINAGDGAHEHPTQGLLDMFTLREKHGSLENLRVCVVGDILHSRVARSNIYGLQTMGAKVSVCGPATLIPREIERMGVAVYHRLEDVIPEVDALNVLRVQLERQKRGLFPSLREYHRYFGVTKEKVQKASRPLTIMHPGPINRDVELSADLADSEHSVILQQVTNGVAVRMAVLYLLGTV